MAFKLIIPGADFSALGNPKVEDFVEGLPGNGLAALYLFDQGNVGQAYAGPAVDYSGNARAASLIASSTAFKTATGVATSITSTRTKGFGVMSPVPISEKFTVFGVSRNLMAADAAIVNQYAVPWTSSGNFAVPTAPDVASSSSASSYPADSGGLLHINQQNNGTNANAAEIATLHYKPGASTAWTGGGIRPSTSVGGTPKDSWIAWALAFDKDVGYTFRALGSGHGVASKDDATVYAAGQIAKGGKHVFGYFGFQGSQIIGEMAMAGVYSGIAKSAAEMDTLIAAMKVRLAARIPTIL